MNNKIIIILVGILLTTAKGFKIGGSIGIGEIICLMAIGYSILGRNKNENFINIKSFVIFWGINLTLLISGIVVRVFILKYPFVFPRTLFAYILCIAIMVGLNNMKFFSEYKEKVMFLYTHTLGIISVIFTVIYILNIKSLLGMNMYWKGSGRFQGWATDPNQFAIILIPLLFLALYMLNKTIKRKEKKPYIIYILCFFILMGATQSDTLIMSFIAGVLFIIIRYFCNNKQWMIKSIILTIGILISIITFAMNNEIISDIINKFNQDFILKDGQFLHRFNLWIKAFYIMMISPLTGLGPDTGIRGFGYVIGEAHNIYLQFGMSTGVIGMISLIILQINILTKCNLLKGNKYLISAIIAIFVFGLTHNVLRHPSWWFSIWIIMVNCNINNESSLKIKH